MQRIRTRWHDRDAAPLVLGGAWLVVMALVLIAIRTGLVDRGPACPWRSVTGVACPSCGATRAASALLLGEVGRAWSINPLATLLMLGWPVACGAWWWMRRAGMRVGAPIIAGTLAALVLANWVYVLLRGV